MNKERLRQIDRAMAAVLFDKVYGPDEYESWCAAGGLGNEAFVDGAGEVYRQDRVWRPTEYMNDWYRAETFMASTYCSPGRKRLYVWHLYKLVRPGIRSDDRARALSDYSVVFEIATAPLPLRCLAFLLAANKEMTND